MHSLIITSGNSKNFQQLRNFVLSLRSQGQYTGLIVLCDNSISGTWDNPGTWQENDSFREEEKQFFKEQDVSILQINTLVNENTIDPEIIRNIKSPTQRYPYKFVYNTLISKLYINKVKNIFYFDSDIYFQAPFEPIAELSEAGKILIVKEFLKMQEGYFLPKWLKFSDFSKVSDQDEYLKTMLPAENFCSGFYGSEANTFHRFNLLALLLTSNQFINFYSDQPLVNILKTYFHYPFKEISNKYCLHLGELKRENYTVENGKFTFEGKIPIAVHFNSGKYQELESVLTGIPLPSPPKRSLVDKVVGRLKKAIR